MLNFYRMVTAVTIFVNLFAAVALLLGPSNWTNMSPIWFISDDIAWGLVVWCFANIGVVCMADSIWREQTGLKKVAPTILGLLAINTAAAVMYGHDAVVALEHAKHAETLPWFVHLWLWQLAALGTTTVCLLFAVVSDRCVDRMSMVLLVLNWIWFAVVLLGWYSPAVTVSLWFVIAMIAVSVMGFVAVYLYCVLNTGLLSDRWYLGFKLLGFVSYMVLGVFLGYLAGASWLVTMQPYDGLFFTACCVCCGLLFAVMVVIDTQDARQSLSKKI